MVLLIYHRHKLLDPHLQTTARNRFEFHNGVRTINFVSGSYFPVHRLIPCAFDNPEDEGIQ
jgi:hypothetical protein